MSAAVIALGANLGDREQTIRDAVAALQAANGVRVTAASTLVQTPALKPDGVDLDAPAYLNAVVLLQTELEPQALLRLLHEIEQQHGRVRDVRWGDRTLDLDIVVFDDVTLNAPDLTLPHPRAGERDFVLAPWAQLQPDAELPGRGRIDALITAIPDDYPAEALL